MHKTKKNIENQWHNEFLALIKRVAAKHDEFTAETVRKAYSRSRIGNPTSNRESGPCYRKAIKLGFIEKTGRYQQSESRNGNPLPVYRSKLFKPNK